jgi:hypothetical protein
MPNATQINFGVELETTMPNTDTTPIGSYHNGITVAWLPTGWRVERDSSIRCVPGRNPAEFVSPVMCGQDGLDSIKTACEAIVARGGKVNDSCGVHVTVTFNGGAAALARLLSLVAHHEDGLYATAGTVRRRQATWCKSIKDKKDVPTAMRDRYQILNLTHVALGKNRVEFRVFSGSLNADKIQAWVQLCVGLVQLACDDTRKKCDWQPRVRTGRPWQGKTQAEGEVARLFYRLGWTGGHYPKDNATFGIIGDVKMAKKEMRRMAVAYNNSLTR